MNTNFAQLKEKDKLSETQFYTVVKKAGAKVQLMNDLGENIIVDKAYAEKLLISADQFSETKKITKTEAANLFLMSHSIVLTVNFNTQVKEKDAKEELYKLYPNTKGRILSLADFKDRVDSIVKSVITGEARTMVGRHFGEANEFGRVNFIDMEQSKDPAKEYDTRLRQVDPRTINWMIIKGVKYEIK